MVTIERLSPRLVNELKAVRLHALQDMPVAFSGTYARESQLSDQDWLDRASTWSGIRSVCYIALDDGAPCGLIAGKFQEDHPQRADVLSMWVAATHRRMGLGNQLVEAVQAWALQNGAIELRLMVTSKNATAMRFYEKCGFAFTGVTGPYPNDPAIFEFEMVKFIQGA